MLSKLAQVLRQDVSQTNDAIVHLQEEIRKLNQEYEIQTMEFNNKTTLLENKVCYDKYVFSILLFPLHTTHRFILADTLAI